MHGLLTLVSIENRKLSRRISTKIMMLILALLVIGFAGLQKFIEVNFSGIMETYTGQQQTEKTGDWRTQLEMEIESYELQLAEARESENFLSKSSIGILEMTIAENEYRLEHDISEYDTTSIWSAMDAIEASGFGGMIALFVIIACSAAVAGEFTDGTIKLMIPRPFSRSQILTSKLFSTLLYALVLFAETFLIAFLVSGIWFGFAGIGTDRLLWTGEKIILVPAAVKTLIIYGLDFLQVLVFVALAFMIAVLSRSRALATGVSIFLLFVGASLTSILALYFSWGKYLLLPVTEFSSFILNGTTYEGTSLGFALILSAVYTAVFVFISYFAFKKRDI